MNLYDKASLILTPNAYKASKIYAAKPTDGSGDLTFSRASAKVRRNASGVLEALANNVPALEYSVGGGCPAWLLEPQRTNLLTYSNEFDNAAWSKYASTVSPNIILSPDGSQNADFFIENSANTEHYLNRSFTNQNSVFTHSIYAKKGGRDWIKLYAFATVPNDFTYIVYANFNLNTGAIGATNNCNAKIEDAGNGWFRCIMTSTTIYPQTSTGVGYLLFTCSADNVVTYLGTGTMGVYLYGAQAEAGASATSYIPTTTASVTRVADFGSKNFGTYTEGTIFYDDIPLSMENYGGSIMLSALSNSTASCIGLIDYANGNTELYTARAGVSASGVIGPDTKNTRRKYCIVFSQTRIDVYKNGNTTPVLSITDATKIPASISFYNINYNVGGALEMSYLVNTLLFSPTLFTAAEAAAITAL